MSRILVTRRLPAAILAKLDAVGTVDLHDGTSELSPDELRERVMGKQGVVSMLNDRIDRVILDAGRDLRVVANVAVGFNNIDVPYATSRGVVVTNTPDVLTEPVADFTWGLILALTRRLAEGDRLVRQGGWKGWAFDFMLGAELRGKQLGIIGFGRIGRAVAARAGAFGMRVAYAGRTDSGMHGRGVQPSRSAGAQESGLQTAEEMPLDRVLVSSDVVSLHVPLTPDTRHLIDRKALARMKRSAYLINTARGPVVDEAALVWALEERLIAGAALDVYEHEPVVHPDLLRFENALLVPHLASATTETRTAMADLAVQNVIAVLTGQPPLTPVVTRG